MRESKFQADLKKELKTLFPGCIVTKLDSSDIQGIPDLLKRSAKAPKRPNQGYYVNKMNAMSFSRIIFPENKEEVLNELQKAFES